MLSNETSRYICKGIRIRVLSFTYAQPATYEYHKMLLNENESYLVLVARQCISNDQ